MENAAPVRSSASNSAIDEGSFYVDQKLDCVFSAFSRFCSICNLMNPASIFQASNTYLSFLRHDADASRIIVEEAMSERVF